MPHAQKASDSIEFRELPPSALQYMEQRRAFIADLAVRHSLDHRLTKTESDSALIQEILDKKLIQKGQLHEQRALGVIFGDVLRIKLRDFQWMEATDAWGTDPCLVSKDKTIKLNPLSMFEKRLEAEEEVFVSSLTASVIDIVVRESGDGAEREKEIPAKN